MPVSSPNIPPPEPRALLIVVDAARQAGTASVPALSEATLAHPGAREVPEALLRRTVESYAEAAAGYRPPPASGAYVLAALYAMRRRVAIWIGVPFAVLSTLGLSTAFADWKDRHERLHTLLTRIGEERTLLGQTQESIRELGDAERSARPAPLNVQTLEKTLSRLRTEETEASAIFEQLDPNPAADEKSLRRLNRLRTAAEGAVQGLREDLERAREEFEKARGLWLLREQLDRLLAAGKALPMSGDMSSKLERSHRMGSQALERGDESEASERLAEMSGWLAEVRDLARLPDRLEALIKQIRESALEKEVRANAEAIHRQGCAALERSDPPLAREAIHLLTDLAARLEERYAIRITGGKWRYKNSDPSNRSYYLIVEAIDGSGRKLSRVIRNEETGASESVTAWGERVPFAVYERVRRDKQAHGVVQQNEFGLKERGRLEPQVTLQSDDGVTLPRVGQITRW